jgi:hypothetical protein
VAQRGSITGTGVNADWTLTHPRSGLLQDARVGLHQPGPPPADAQQLGACRSLMSTLIEAEAKDILDGAGHRRRKPGGIADVADLSTVGTKRDLIAKIE